MEEGQPTHGNTRWPLRMAFISFSLFSIFWSLHSFFFWTLLSLSAYFIFLHFYTSGGVAAWLDGIFSGLRKSSQPSPNPFEAYKSRQAQEQPAQGQPSTQNKAKGLAQLVVVVFFFIFLFSFLYGIFSRFDQIDETAESLTNEVIDEEKENGTTYWLEKGNIALGDEKQDSAFYYYGQALAIDPENMYGLYNTGLIYMLREDYRKSNGFARRCLLYHPEYNPAWWLLGWNYDKTNQTDSSLYTLEQAYQNEYYQPEFLQLLADVYEKKGDRRKALEVYQRMYSFDSTKTDYLQRMIELDPSNAEKYRQQIEAVED